MSSSTTTSYYALSFSSQQVINHGVEFSATSDVYGNVVVRNKTTGEVKGNIASSLLSELQNPTSDFKSF